MFSKITSIFNLFRKGQEVANVEAWKSGQVTANILAGVMLAGVQVAKAFDYEIPLTEEVANSIAIGILATVNFIFTVITSKKAGVLPTKPTNTEPLPEIEPISSKEPIREVPAPIEDHSFTK